jgi:hypothetical protein
LSHGKYNLVMNDKQLSHLRKKFIDEPIQIYFDQPQLYEKTPNCPTGFTWRGQLYQPLEMLSTWHDFRQHTEIKNNNKSELVKQSLPSGSWGVGKFYFIVRTQDNRLFEIYFDRNPQNVIDRKGHWFLLAELVESTEKS